MVGAPLILWLSLAPWGEQLVLLKSPSLDNLGQVARLTFPRLGIASLHFSIATEGGDRLKEDADVLKLENETVIHLESDSNYTKYEVLSERPRIFYFPEFLTDEECDKMIEIGKPYVKESQVGDGSANGRKDNSIRSSQVHFLTYEQEQEWATKSIKRKVYATTKLPYEHMEALQLQYYSAPEGKKKKKFDLSDHDFYVPHMDSLGTRPAERRIATHILYLSDVEEGGETVFPMARKDSVGRPAYDLDATQAMNHAQTVFLDICKNDGSAPFDAIKIKPKKGSAVLFYSLKPNRELDALAVHGSCPVIKGQKWISQQWIRESAHEPLWSAHLEGFWGLDILTNRDGKGAISRDGVGGEMTETHPKLNERREWPIEPLGLRLMREREVGGGGGAVVPYTTELREPTHVVKMKDAVHACIRQGLLQHMVQHDLTSVGAAGVLSNVRHSHALTLTFWVKQDPAQSAEHPSEIIISTATGKKCCEWRLLFENGEEGNGVMMAGPERGSPIDEGMGMALALGEWNLVTLTMENSKPLQPHGKRSKVSVVTPTSV
jgi:prolyl 4-hydroxylase